MSATVAAGSRLPAVAGVHAVRASYGATLRSLAAARWRPFLAYCVLLLAVNVTRSLTVLPMDAFPSEAHWIDDQLQHVALLIFLVSPPIFVAIVAVEALRLRGALHLLASLGAIAAALALGLAMGALAFGGSVSGNLVGMRIVLSDAAFIARELWTYLASGGLLVLYFASREREAESARVAQATDLERMQAERTMAASRLKVLQARVEPELLFGALGEVRELFLRDPAGADALLDDLIAYLRAALPQMRGETSTLGSEVRLATTYVRAFVAGRGVARLPVDERVAEGLDGLPFPPLVVLPIAQALARTRPARLTLSTVRSASGGIELALVAEAPERAAGWSEETLAALRGRLALQLGDGVRLEPGPGHVAITFPATA